MDVVGSGVGSAQARGFANSKSTDLGMMPMERLRLCMFDGWSAGSEQTTQQECVDGSHLVTFAQVLSSLDFILFHPIPSLTET